MDDFEKFQASRKQVELDGRFFFIYLVDELVGRMPITMDEIEGVFSDGYLSIEKTGDSYHLQIENCFYNSKVLRELEITLFDWFQDN